ncbi:hypothetical protein LR48_Vigan10g183000 [Vigna angularis]|uniref:Uncharacterized protein n=1 Tax=Phaseolus angularis TaxID=3914 RepID=A0A0L9VLV1_PHAAN|nr:hypothetical protein LR48_Vigan10g183000 [Vigna angularis]
MNGELDLTTKVEMEEGRRPKVEEGLFPQLLACLQELQLRENVFVIHEDDDMAEAEDDPLSKLMTKLPRYMDTIVVDQGRSSMYEFVEPQTIQPSGNTLQNRQHYLHTWMDESKRDIYLVPYIDGHLTVHNPTSNPTLAQKPFRHLVVGGYTSDVCIDVGGEEAPDVCVDVRRVHIGRLCGRFKVNLVKEVKKERDGIRKVNQKPEKSTSQPEYEKSQPDEF